MRAHRHQARTGGVNLVAAAGACRAAWNQCIQLIEKDDGGGTAAGLQQQCRKGNQEGFWVGRRARAHLASSSREVRAGRGDWPAQAQEGGAGEQEGCQPGAQQAAVCVAPLLGWIEVVRVKLTPPLPLAPPQTAGAACAPPLRGTSPGSLRPCGQRR